MKTKKKGYGILLGISIFFTLLTLSTLLPQASASKACMLGYDAHCSFTPVSTIIMAIMTAAVCKIRSKFFTEGTVEN